MAQLQNQFAQTEIKGSMDLRFNPAVMSAQIDSSEVGTLVPGQAVTLVDSAGGVPKVIAAAADTADVFGFIVYDIKSTGFVALDKVEIATMRDNVQYMEAGAAVARGAKVMIVVTGSKVVLATTGKTIVGRALDKATASGDLIRVTIDLPGTVAP